MTMNDRIRAHQFEKIALEAADSARLATERAELAEGRLEQAEARALAAEKAHRELVQALAITVSAHVSKIQHRDAT